MAWSPRAWCRSRRLRFAKGTLSRVVVDLACAQPEPLRQHLGGMLAEQRRPPGRRWRRVVEAHGAGDMAHVARSGVLHRLHHAALEQLRRFAYLTHGADFADRHACLFEHGTPMSARLLPE